MAITTATRVANTPRMHSTTEIIDLTDSPPGTPPRLTYRPAPVSHDERPAKRVRTLASMPTPPPAAQPAVSQPMSRSLSDCLQAQIVPLLRPLLRSVPPLLAGDITTKIVRDLIHNPTFKSEVENTGGYLPEHFVGTLNRFLRDEIGGEIRAYNAENFRLRNNKPPIPVPSSWVAQPEALPSRKPALGTKAPRPNTAPPKPRQQAQSSTPESSRPAAPAPPQQPLLPSHAKHTPSQNPARRPYLPVSARKSIAHAATKRLLLPKRHVLQERHVYHVDFTPEEIEAVRGAVRVQEGKQAGSKREPLRELGKTLRKSQTSIETFAQNICLKDGLESRDTKAVLGFLQDAVKKQSTRPGAAQALGLRLEVSETLKRPSTKDRISSLLLAREIEGNRGFGKMRSHVNFTQEFRKAREDDLEMRAEWTNCAGDIATISWVGDGDHFVCGTTTHSDSHNQQYNKPGNLLLCSPGKGRLQAYPDHRTPRPVVPEGENGTDAMRESQDPWLYTSVVSSDYDAVNRLAYTSSFDRTVKVWSVDQDAGTMRAVASWTHGGNVNFVAASKNGSGLIATAADVPTQAVRIYKADQEGIATTYIPLSGLRSWNEDDENTSATQTWAYFPATMQWGIAKGVQHLLLVGYSPRSLTGDDNDIPVEKRNSGEILLWDCMRNERLRVLTASTQNVFEVAWHPTQPSFVVATSPSGLLVKEHVRTQIRLFRPSNNPEHSGAFSEVQCLDCPAIDINELTIVPNSLVYCYVTAAATNGVVYVWDTARGDDPIHKLAHGTPLEGDASEEHYDRERDDTGVKFTAWGTSLDRFYTGGSDGVVKVWSIRNEQKPLVRVILEAPAPISTGSFSPDKTKLAIGDATGRVYLFSVNEIEGCANTAVKLPPGFAGNIKSMRRPRPYTPHEAPPLPPNNDPIQEPTTGLGRAALYLALQQIRVSSNRTIGAVQGPAYASLGLYREELHKDGERDKPLLAHVEQQQQENQTMFKGKPRVRTLIAPHYDALKDAQHYSNYAMDLHLGELPEETQLELTMAGVSLEDPIEEGGDDWDLQYEEE